MFRTTHWMILGLFATAACGQLPEETGDDTMVEISSDDDAENEKAQADDESDETDENDEDDESDESDEPVAPLTWSRVDENDGPAAREHTVMWIDPVDPDSMYLYGGYLYEPEQFTPAFDMWRLDLDAGTWSEVEQTGDPPLTTAGEIALTDTPGVAMHVGGSDATGALPTSLGRVAVDGDEARWTWKPSTEEEELGLQLGAFVWDADRDRHLWVGGLVDVGDGMGLLPGDALLGFVSSDGLNHELVLPETGERAPTARYGAAWALDGDSDRLVVFGGAQEPTESDLVNPASDAWALDLSSEPAEWSRLEPGGDSPVGRRNGCHAYDPIGDRLFVFGGTANGRTSVEGLHVLSLAEGEESWETLEVENGPAARASCTAVYDAKRRRILFGFGNNSVAVYSDVWALQL